MTERQLILPGWAVLAIMAGQKRQIRRLVHPEPTRLDGTVGSLIPQVVRKWRGRDVVANIPCPLGQVGDRLWVKEPAWLLEEPMAGAAPDVMPGDPLQTWVLAAATDDGPNVAYQADHENPPPVPREGQRWKRSSALHLPRVYSRITLEVIRVRCEKLQSLSEADARDDFAPLDVRCRHRDIGLLPDGDRWTTVFAAAWDEAHGDGQWAMNPHVWAVTFKVAT